MRSLLAGVAFSLMLTAYGTSDDDQDSPLKGFLSYAGIAVTSQPANAVGVIGGTVTFGPVAYTTQLPIAVTLQWEVQIGGSASPWHVLVETPGFYEGVATATLSVKSLDNFLADSPSSNFRLALFYPGTAPIYSNVATLSIPLHTNWIAGLSGNFTAQNGDTAVLPLQLGYFPEAVGFVGVTYQWTYVSGAPFTCTNPASQAGNFSYLGPPGLHFSIWTCTISDGITTITSDLIYLAICFVASGSGLDRFSVPRVSQNGSAFTSVYGFTPGHPGPWLLSFEQRLRIAATPTVLIDAPSSSDSTFSLTAVYPGGSAIVGILNPQAQLQPGFEYCGAATAWVGN